MARNLPLKASLKTLLGLKPDEQTVNELIKMGVPKSKITNGTAIMAALYKKAAKGEVSAIKEIVSIADDDTASASNGISKLYKALGEFSNDS